MTLAAPQPVRFGDAWRGCFAGSRSPPPGPFRRDFWRSPLRGPWITAVFGLVLLVVVTILFVTGLPWPSTPLCGWSSRTRWQSPCGSSAPRHDLLLLLLYAIVDTALVRSWRHRHAVRSGLPPVPATSYVRFPLVVSGMLLLVFWPSILRFGHDSSAATGLAPDQYLGNWLLVTAALFGLSAVAYAVHLRRRGPAEVVSRLARPSTACCGHERNWQGLPTVAWPGGSRPAGSYGTAGWMCQAPSNARQSGAEAGACLMEQRE